MRWMLKWVVWVAVSACGGGQYEAQSAHDASPPPMAPPAPPVAYDTSSAPAPGAESFAGDEDGSGGGEAGGLADSSPVLADEGQPVVAEAASGQVAEATPEPAIEGKPRAEATQVPRQLLLIYRAELVLAVFETRATLDKIEALVKQLGGYLVSRSNDVIELRVPVATFQQALEHASGLGDELSRQVTAEDVSDRYRDLKIRLRNAEVVRDRLAALLARATDVKEALMVEEQLSRVTTTIEQLKGKLKVLDELIAYSTITVRLQPHASHEQLASRVALPFPWLGELGLSNLLNLEQQ